MNRAAPLSFVLGFGLSLVLLGCPSKDNSSSSGATSPSGSTGAVSGPLANLDAAPFLNEVWIAEEGGAQLPFVFYAQQNVRVSASCRSAVGQFDCDAIRFLRGGRPFELPRSALSGSVSAGTRACTKMGNKVVTGRSPSGAEDGFCRFPDGSLLSTGALEQYGVRVTD